MEVSSGGQAGGSEEEQVVSWRTQRIGGLEGKPSNFQIFNLSHFLMEKCGDELSKSTGLGLRVSDVLGGNWNSVSRHAGGDKLARLSSLPSVFNAVAVAAAAAAHFLLLPVQ